MKQSRNGRGIGRLCDTDRHRRAGGRNRRRQGTGRDDGWNATGVRVCEPRQRLGWYQGAVRGQARRPGDRRGCARLRHRERVRRREQRASAGSRPGAPTVRSAPVDEGRLPLPRSPAGDPSGAAIGRAPPRCAPLAPARHGWHGQHRRRGVGGSSWALLLDAGLLAGVVTGGRRRKPAAAAYRPHRRVPTPRAARRRPRAAPPRWTTSWRPDKVGRFGVGAEWVEEALAWIGVAGVAVAQLPFGVLDPEAAGRAYPGSPALGVEVWARGVLGGGLIAAAARDPRRVRRPEAAADRRPAVRSQRRRAATCSSWRSATSGRAPTSSALLVGISPRDHLHRNLELMARAASRTPTCSVRRGPSTRARGVAPWLTSRSSSSAAGRAARWRRRRWSSVASTSSMLDAGLPGAARASSSAPPATPCSAAWAGRSTRPTASTRRRPAASTGSPACRSAGCPTTGRRQCPASRPRTSRDGARLDERYVWPVSYEDLEPYYELAEARPDGHGRASPIAGVPAQRVPYTIACRADWQELADAAPRTMVTASARCRWPRAARGWSPGGARSSAATTAWSRRCSAHAGLPLCAPARTRFGSTGRRDRVAVGALPRPAHRRVETVRGPGRGRRGRRHRLDGAAAAVDVDGLPDRPRQHRTVSSAATSTTTPASGGRRTPDRPLRALAHPVYVARPPHAGSATADGDRRSRSGCRRQAERLRTYYRGRSRPFGAQVFGTMVPTAEVGVGCAEPAPTIRASGPRISSALRRTLRSTTSSPRRDRLREVFASAGIELEVPGTVPRAAARARRSTTAAPCGCTPTPQFGVLDRWNRMHDVPNVVVADSSCFTTGPEKNPTLTAMAIAARAADQLADDMAAGWSDRQ